MTATTTRPTPEEVRATLGRLTVSTREAARLAHAHEKTLRRWVAGTAPHPALWCAYVAAWAAAGVLGEEGKPLTLEDVRKAVRDMQEANP